jgi:cell division protein FtsB
MQATLARLVHYHRGSHDLGHFVYFGRRDEHGYPEECVPHYHFGGHMQHMESLLHRTQVRLDHTKMQRNIKANTLINVHQQLQLKEVELEKKVKELEKTKKDLKEGKGDVYREGKISATTHDINNHLQAKNDELEAMLAKMESHIEKLEDEGEDLRKENKALMSDDEDYIEEMDIEDEEPDEDNLAFINDDNEDEEEPLLPEEEEDPDKRDDDSTDD